MNDDWSNVILISGKQGSGKTSLADNLAKQLFDIGRNPVRLRFANVIYQMHGEVMRVAALYGLPTKEKDGSLLQLLGTEWGRATFGEDVWVRCLQNQVRSFGSRTGAVFIIDDCRFPNELFGFPGAFSIRLNCDRDARKGRAHGWRETETHQSETALDDCKDFSAEIFTDIADKAATCSRAFLLWKGHGA